VQIHLDAVGGVAGDMFIAAVLDAFPNLSDGLLAAIRTAGFPRDVTMKITAHKDHALTGLRFIVDDSGHDSTPHRHTDFANIRQLLENSQIETDVRRHAVGIFSLLAEAEAKVHGTTVDEVTFHEIGEWDSIADIVGAAYLITQLAADWSVSPVPIGRGGIQSVHGYLPVPTPATALLLEGFECFDDGVTGERVTPTGAAILRYLTANRSNDGGTRRLLASGTGFGSRQFPGLSNVLRLIAFEVIGSAGRPGRVAEVLFEVDDQSPEDLAIGLDRLRAHPAVWDVLQVPAFGKKSRIAAHIRVLADPAQLQEVCEVCLEETTTIGLRYQVLERMTLSRRRLTIDADGQQVRVKIVQRQNDTTRKAEADDLATVSGGRSGRDRIRLAVETAVLPGSTKE
jgi:hypothetical protein